MSSDYRPRTYSTQSNAALLNAKKRGMSISEAKFIHDRVMSLNEQRQAYEEYWLNLEKEKYNLKKRGTPVCKMIA